MARQPKSIAVADTGAPIDTEKFDTAMEQMRDHKANTALALSQHEERVTALAVQLNYQGSTDPAVLENSARDAIQRIGMGIFELGGYLLLMKEACGHGNFLPALERLGLGPDSAQRYMAVTRRFSNTASGRHLAALGVKKLVELLPLEDEQLVDLTGLGETGELALDDIATMSLKELRAAVRKARADGEKLKARAERQEAVNADLHEEVRMIKRIKPDEAVKLTHREAAEIQAEALGYLQGNVRHALIALNNCEGDQSLYMAGMVGQLMAELRSLRDEFNLPEVDDTPEWEKFAAAQAGASTGKAKTN